MVGRIVKGIGGFYYVHVHNDGIYECKARGIFRKDKVKPLVGDYVELEVLDNDLKIGNIVSLNDRSNELIRPNVANVDQALIIFALTSPEPNFVTLDKMILQYRAQNIPVILCFNKEDIATDEYVEEVLSDYSGCGYRILLTSASKKLGIEELKNILKGKTTTVAGPSGVGKSSLVNCLTGNDCMKVGDISKKLERGKHTTRHSEIIPLDDNTYIIDTPGFGSFELVDISVYDLADYYEEFKVDSACKFMPCSHIHEPGCVIRNMVDERLISKRRYDNYVYIYENLDKRRNNY